MTTRDEYLKQAKAKLDEWNAELARLEAVADTKEAKAKQEYHKQLAALRKRRDDLAVKFDQLKQASQDAWDDLKRGFDEARQTLSDAFDQLGKQTS